MTLVYNSAGNQIGNTTINYPKGLRLGNANHYANGLNSIAIGYNVQTSLSAENAITIGSGTSTSTLNNYITNSLMIGFNSNIPTLTVRSASGINTIGNVGIGTTNPGALLDVKLPSSAPDATMAATFSYDGQGQVFIVPKLCGGGCYNGLSVNGDQGIFWSDGLAGGGHNANAGFVIAPWAGSNAGIRIDASGNVGIGTKQADYKLDVAGTTRACEFIAEIHWCDYVFEPEYKLMPISDLENFLRTNKHLPGIDPGSVIESKGLELAKMNQKLMEKVEELYLYIIQIQKELDELKKKNKIIIY